MASVPSHDNEKTACGPECEIIAPQALIILVAGMAAAWLAAGSTGLLGHPLQHALTWLSLAVALVAAWPRDNRSFGTWAILAGGAILGLSLTASTIPTVNIFAVTVVFYQCGYSSAT